jgi:hypothetical protein
MLGSSSSRRLEIVATRTSLPTPVGDASGLVDELAGARHAEGESISLRRKRHYHVVRSVAALRWGGCAVPAVHVFH